MLVRATYAVHQTRRRVYNNGVELVTITIRRGVRAPETIVVKVGRAAATGVVDLCVYHIQRCVCIYV